MNARKNTVLGLIVAAAALHAQASAEMQACGNNPLKWPGNQVQFTLTSEHFPPGGEFTNALLEAGQAWSQSAAGIQFSFQWNDAVEAGHPSAGNHVYWNVQFSGPHALAMISYAEYTCVIEDVDIWFNSTSYMTVSEDQEDLTAYGGDDLPFRAVALHELGHALGLSHTSTVYSVMGRAETHLHADNGVTESYPGEEAVQAVIGAYGAKSGTYEDLALAHWRRTGAVPAPDNEDELYAVHNRTRLFDAGGDELWNSANIDPVYEVEVGQQVRFELTVENLGKNSQNTVIGYYLSTNDNITTQDTLLAEEAKYVTPNVPATVLSPLLTLPASLNGGQQYWLGAIIDPHQTLAEHGEFNNRTFVKIHTQQLPPELAAVGIYGPNVATAGNNVLLNSVINNLGGPFPGSYAYDLYLSTNNIISTADTLLGTFQSSTFGPQFKSVPLPKTLLGGTYYYGVRIHPEHGGDSSNNTAVSSAVTINPGPPDLWAEVVSGPRWGFIGQSVQMQVKVTSLAGPLPGPYTFSVRLSSDNIPGPSDYLVKSITSSKLGTHMISGTIPATLPGPGTYYWVLVVNTSQGETVLTNNVKLGATVKVYESYDMAAASITGPLSVKVGSNTEVNFQAANAGVPWNGPWAYDICVHSGPGSLVIPVHTGWAQGTGPQTASFQMPQNLSPGTYTWMLKVYPLFGEYVLDNNWVSGNNVNIK